MYGKSTFITPTPAGFVAAAEFYDFAPNSCICHQPCVGEDQRKRTYAHGTRVCAPLRPLCRATCAVRQSTSSAARTLGAVPVPVQYTRTSSR
jgi:hypothetical protein